MDLTLRVTPTLFGHVHRESFLDALNSGEVFVNTHKEWSRILMSRGQKPRGRRPGSRTYQRAKDAFRARLRIYLDEWIETGRTPDGMETTTNRGLGGGVVPNAPHALQAAMRVTGALHVHFRNEGGLEIFFAPYIANCSLSELADREAARFFAWFLASGWRNTIVKCRKPACGRYFAIKNTQHLYKRGTFCRKHSSAKSAEVITAEKRQRKRAFLLRLATAAIKQHQKLAARERKELPLKDYVADYVNKRTPSAMKSVAPKWPITAKWVTRSLRESISSNHVPE